MSDPMWDEFARVQNRVSHGELRDEHLDAYLVRYFDEKRPFDLHDCHRWSKNLSRNLARKASARQGLLEREAIRLCPASFPPPPVILIRQETRATVRRRAGDNWGLLRMTIDGDYAAVAADVGVAIGTVKSRVSRAKQRLRSAFDAG